MLELKKLSHEAVEGARKKALHYRLLNQPFLAESICRDILDVEPNDPEALVTLCLSLCDQFGTDGGATHSAAMTFINRISDEYERAYYSGIASERMAFAKLGHATFPSGQLAYEWFVRAMEHYDRAAAIRPAGNDDAILRWNTCARVMNGRSDVHAGQDEPAHTMLE